MAAMFVMLFSFGVGSAWGETVSLHNTVSDTTFWKNLASEVGEGNYVLYEYGTRVKSSTNYSVYHFLRNTPNTGKAISAVDFPVPSPMDAKVFTLVKNGDNYRITFKNGNETYYIHSNSNIWDATTTTNIDYTFTNCKTNSETKPRYSIYSPGKTKYVCIYNTAATTPKIQWNYSGKGSTANTTYDPFYNRWCLIPEASFHSVGHHFRCDADVKVVTYAYGATPDRSTGTNNSDVARVAFLDVAFGDMPTDANVIGDTRRWATTYNVPVYFKKNDIDGYLFTGWYDGDGNKLSEDPAYGTTIAVSNSSTTANRTHKTVYAYFEEAPLFQATLLDVSGNTVMDGTIRSNIVWQTRLLLRRRIIR